MGITQLNPQRHLVRDTPHTHYLRRHLKDEALLTYFNLDTQQWVLGYWIDRNRGVIDEIEDLGPNFERLTRELVKSLERTYAFYTKDDLKKRYLRRARHFEQKMREETAEANEQWNWCKKRTKEKAPVPWMVSTGRMQGGQSAPAKNL